MFIAHMDTGSIRNVKCSCSCTMFQMLIAGAQIQTYTYLNHIYRCRRLWCTIPPFLKPFIKLYCGLVDVSMWLNRKFIVASVWYQNFNCFFFPFREHFWCSSFFLIAILVSPCFTLQNGMVIFCKSFHRQIFFGVSVVRSVLHVWLELWGSIFTNEREQKKINWNYLKRAEFVKWICFAGLFPLWQRRLALK